MSDQFIGEIRMFGGNFAPTGWAFCDGQLLAISQNTALFSLLGTNYGGNGQTNFALPNLRGRTPLHAGQGPGLTDRPLGSSGGVETVTLTEANVAPHSHSAIASAGAASTGNPAGALLAATAAANPIYVGAPGATLTMGPLSIVGGASTPHNNLQPYLVLSFIIALQGIYPPRS
jgi:microcystin-dependent protein